jgi:hypothetical protein
MTSAADGIGKAVRDLKIHGQALCDDPCDATVRQFLETSTYAAMVVFSIALCGPRLQVHLAMRQPSLTKFNPRTGTHLS